MYPPEAGTEESEVVGFDYLLTRLRKGDPLHLYNSNSLQNNLIIYKKEKSYPLTGSNDLKITINIKFINRK